MKAQEPRWNSYDVGQKLAFLSPRAPSSIGYCFLEHQPGTLADSCLQTFINRKQQGIRYIMAELINDYLFLEVPETVLNIFKIRKFYVWVI